MVDFEQLVYFICHKMALPSCDVVFALIFAHISL